MVLSIKSSLGHGHPLSETCVNVPKDFLQTWNTGWCGTYVIKSDYNFWKNFCFLLQVNVTDVEGYQEPRTFEWYCRASRVLLLYWYRFSLYASHFLPFVWRIVFTARTYIVFSPNISIAPAPVFVRTSTALSFRNFARSCQEP